jgi:hypothetical protein
VASDKSLPSSGPLFICKQRGVDHRWSHKTIPGVLGTNDLSYQARHSEWSCLIMQPSI